MQYYKEDGSDINIAMCLSSYMVKAEIMRCYESCKMQDPYGPEHFIDVDGVYKFFRFQNKPTPKYSDDGSNEWMEKQPRAHLIKFSGGQNDKRMQYVNKAAELGCDVLIVIDSDEYLHPQYSDWKEFRKWLVKYIRSYDPEGYGIIFNMLSWIDKDYVKAYNTTEVDQFTPVPRIWHRPEKMEYYNEVHYWVRRKNTPDPRERLATGSPFTIDLGVRMAQDSKLRDQEFIDARDEWAKQGIFYEDRHIKQYNTTHGIPYVSIANTVFRRENSLVSLNPLLVVLTNYYDEQVITDYKRIMNIDKIYLDGFEFNVDALNKAKDFFTGHDEFSHLIIASDRHNVTRVDVNKLFPSLARNYDIVSAYSRAPVTNGYSFSIESFDWRADTIAYLSDIGEVEKNEHGLLEVRYTDFILLAIARRVLHRIDFEKSYEKLFCWDVTHNDYHIYVDPEIEIPFPTVQQKRMFVKNPTLLFEKRIVDIEAFQS